MVSRLYRRVVYRMTFVIKGAQQPGLDYTIKPAPKKTGKAQVSTRASQK